MERSNMVLNPENYHSGEKTYSSLTDLYQIRLFHEDFENRLLLKKEEENGRRQELTASLFDHQLPVSDNRELYQKLFLDSKQMTIQKQPEPPAQTGMPSWIVPGAGILITGFVFLVLWYHQSRRNRRKRELFNQTLEFQSNDV